MPGELVPQIVADRFYFITSAVGGRARGASLMIEEDSAGMFIGNGPWSAPVTKQIYEEQATFVRGEASGYTTGDDVTIAGDMIDLAITANYHMQGLPSEAIDIITGRDTGCPAPFSMLMQHELGHVTVHPAGDNEGYKRQAESMPLPQTNGFTSRTMNLLSDLVLNHSVMHSANIRGLIDFDEELLLRRKALYGLAGLYMLPQCTHYETHAELVEAGTLPDTRYVPTEPCTAESDPDLGPAIPCPVAAAGGTHDIGCYDDHFVDPNEPDNADNFMRFGHGYHLWQGLTGHGRGKQIYPMASSAVRYDLPPQFRTFTLGSAQVDQSPLRAILDSDTMTVCNCTKCGNVWYPHDTAYTDFSLGAFVPSGGGRPDSDFRELMEDYREGRRCPGRVPWDRAYSCDATSDDIVVFEMELGREYVVEETKTYDNRPSSDTAMFGMEPIWVLGIDRGDVLIRSDSSTPVPNVWIDRSYMIQLCPDCGKATQNYYGGGYMHNKSGYLTEFLERLPVSSASSPDMNTLNQLLMMVQWSGIYAGMAPVAEEPDLRIRMPSGSRASLGQRSAKEWMKIVGISRARVNRGC